VDTDLNCYVLIVTHALDASSFTNPFRRCRHDALLLYAAPIAVRLAVTLLWMDANRRSMECGSVVLTSFSEKLSVR
jgi:hypothetical protein